MAIATPSSSASSGETIWAGPLPLICRAIVFLIVTAAVAAVVWKYEQDLPDYTQLQNYEPPVMTRVHAGDGSPLAEYAHERRLYLPSSAIPPLVKEAFISAEDKNFYVHLGFDPEGILRAGYILLQGSKHVQGASTITQQVARNFLLNNERTFDRKIREILLSGRASKALIRWQSRRAKAHGPPPSAPDRPSRPWANTAPGR